MFGTRAAATVLPPLFLILLGVEVLVLVPFIIVLIHAMRSLSQVEIRSANSSWAGSRFRAILWQFWLVYLLSVHDSMFLP